MKVGQEEIKHDRKLNLSKKRWNQIYKQCMKKVRYKELKKEVYLRQERIRGNLKKDVKKGTQKNKLVTMLAGATKNRRWY